ncbi:MFS transporter [Bremerella cremea]|uniref:MFS transporter n=1 Tax=Bremerella cremea TaxID=1031537 RepID=UPI0031E77723
MKPYLSDNPALRLSTLCILYAAQGIPDGFVRIALKTYLISEQVSTEAIGTVVAMVSWPWALKWIWGPFIDRFGYLPMGRRRPWILAAQFLMTLTLGAMAFIPELTTSVGIIAAMVLLVNVFASLQDVSVDALAVDMLPAKERGVANGFMFASSYGGTFIGGAILGHIILSYGFPSAVSVQITILLLIAAVPLCLRERPGDLLWPSKKARDHHSRSEEMEHPASLRALFQMLFRAFSLRSTILGASLAVLSLIAINSHLIIWPVYLQRELGWTSSDWLFLEGQLAVWFGLGGSVLGGILASTFGTKRTVIFSLVALSTCWLAYPMTEAYWSNSTVVTILFLVESTLAAFLQVSMFALFMGICWRPIAATQFTAFMALLNVSNGLGARFSGTMEWAFNISELHIFLAILQIVLVAIVLAINPKEVSEKLEDPHAPKDSSETPDEVMLSKTAS